MSDKQFVYISDKLENLIEKHFELIETAPKTGALFLAYQDGELYICKWCKENNCFAYRMHTYRKLTTSEIVEIEHKGKMVEAHIYDKSKEKEFFDHNWSLYARIFGVPKPTHWKYLIEEFK